MRSPKRKHNLNDAEFKTWLFSNVEKLEGDDACWVWKLSTNKKGYGTVSWRGRLQLVHRVVYILTFGELPNDKPCALHHCDNPPCCRPDHLFAGTRPDNIEDMYAKEREYVLKGEEQGRAKLTNPKIKFIRKVCPRLVSMSALSRKFDVSVQTISRVVHRENWRHIY